MDVCDTDGGCWVEKLLAVFLVFLIKGAICCSVVISKWSNRLIKKSAHKSSEEMVSEWVTLSVSIDTRLGTPGSRSLILSLSSLVFYTFSNKGVQQS